jgi:hypothetical protein
MKIKAEDINKSGKEDVLTYCMGCHTLTTMLHSVNSHYLLDSVLWALGDDMIPSIRIPKSVRKKAISKYNDPTMVPLKIF